MSAIIGIILGTITLFLGNHLVGNPFEALLKSDAAVIIFGGTASALLVHAEWKDIVSAVKQTRWLVSPPPRDPIHLIKDICEWSKIARAGSLISLSEIAQNSGDRFVKVGLETLMSTSNLEDVRDTLYQIGEVEDRENMQGGEVWEAAGGYAPTIGVMGAVIGLIHVMLRLSHPSELGAGIATAFVATIYGLWAANIIFIPLGNRLKGVAAARTTYREIATEGLLMMAAKKSHLQIREHLENLLESRRRAVVQPEDNNGAGMNTARAAE